MPRSAAAAAAAAAGATARYEKLGLDDALSRPYDYPAACRELSWILRLAYSKLPKGLQSIVFRDTLAAFRRLPEVETSYGISSAHLLVQAAEATLPKQKKTAAVSEFKHAVVTLKRNHKTCEQGSLQLPHDVLLHIFSFLDIGTLVTAGLVCRQWNSAANDNMPWQLQYSLLFGKYHVCCKTEDQAYTLVEDKKDYTRYPSKCVDPLTIINWREAFKRKYKGNPSWRISSDRMFCCQCRSIIWLSNVTCVGSHSCLKLETEESKIRCMPPDKVVEYLLGDESDSDSDCDSDSDSEYDASNAFTGLQLPKLWAFPGLQI